MEKSALDDFFDRCRCSSAPKLFRFHFLTTTWLILLGLHDSFTPNSVFLPPVGYKRTSRIPLFVARGDARGAALLLENVSVFRGPNQIISNVDWRVEPKAKWAILAVNGAGKSTLLKAIMGELLHDGSITVGSTIRIGYLEQTSVSGSTKTVYDEVASAMTEIEEAKQEMENAALMVENDPSDSNLADLDRVSQRYEAVGGYHQEQTVAVVLQGLGFSDFDKKCDDLSGGWQMRVSLARLLLSKPSLLILDEPSNHLDVAARAWLAQYLRQYEDGAMILVTHDLNLLKNSVQHIAELSSGSLQVYKSCTYDQFLDEKRFRAERARIEFDKNQQKAAELQKFVDRWGASATKASAAQSRVKQLDKMRKAGLIDEPGSAITRANCKPMVMLPEAPRTVGEVFVELEDASIGYTNVPLLTHVNLMLKKGMKLWIRGANGSAKSTLLAALRGALPLLDGKRNENGLLSLGVFTQDLAQDLDVEARALDLVTAYARGRGGDINICDEMARECMGRLGLGGQKPLQSMGDLSGGEKARVALAQFCLKPSNVLMLDEPSNHLDTECVGALSEALSSWGSEDGATVVISHDRQFVSEIGFTHVGTLAEGRFTLEERGVLASDWYDADGSNTGIQSVSTGREKCTEPRQKSRREQQRSVYNAPKRINKLEQLINEAEVRASEIEAEMLENGTNFELLVELSKDKEKVEAQIENHLEEWESLEALLEAVDV